MTRSITAGFRNELEASSGSDLALVFLTITHPQISSVVRMVADTVDYIRDGERFYGVPFIAEMLSDGDQAPKGTINIPDTGGQISETLRAINSPMRLKMELLAGSDFGSASEVLDTHTNEMRQTRSPLGTPVVQLMANHLRLTQATGSDGVIRAQIGSYDLSTLPYPSLRATPERLPALFY